MTEEQNALIEIISTINQKYDSIDKVSEEDLKVLLSIAYNEYALQSDNTLIKSYLIVTLHKLFTVQEQILEEEESPYPAERLPENLKMEDESILNAFKRHRSF